MSIKKLSIYIIWVIVMITFPIVSKAEGADGIHFVKGKWGNAAKLAIENNKPIMVFIGAPYCNFSQRMTEIFNNNEVGIFFNNRFVCKQMDSENPIDNFRASNWGVSSVPSFLFLNKDGRIIHRVSGYRDKNDIIAEAGKALKKIETDNRRKLKE